MLCIFANVMLQDTLKYGPTEVAQPESVHQTITLLGPLNPVLPDSLRQGIPLYANPQSKPTDSIFAQLELNQFFKTFNESQDTHFFKGKSAHLEKSIFTSSQLHAVTLKPTLKNESGFNWLTGILIICFIIYTVTQFLYSKRLKQIFKAAVARRYVNQLVREGGLFNERISIGLLFIFFITATTFIFQGTRYILNIQFPHPELTFCAIFACLLLFWLLKVTMIKFLGFVFKNEAAASEHNLTGLIYFEIIGLILLPLSLPAVFQDPQLFSKIGLFVILAGLLINLSRGFMVGLYNTKFSIFYLILYLCTLEILPLVVVAKIFINN
jgi:hypothetical protein